MTKAIRSFDHGTHGHIGSGEISAMLGRVFGFLSRDPYIIHLSIATCKWWFHFILVEKAMFQMGKMHLFRSPVQFEPLK